MSDRKTHELKQKRIGESRQFFLESNRIRLITNDLNGENEYYIDYDSLSTTTRTATQQNGKVWLNAIGLGLFTLFVLVFGLLTNHTEVIVVAILSGSAALALFGLHFYQKRRYLLVELNNKKQIFFIADKPSPEQLASFIKALYEARNNYFRQKYTSLDPEDDPDERLARLKWLLKEELISEAEFQEKKASVDALRENNRDLHSNTSEA